ncbi:hypothetical protein D9M68_522480 [compost metagenome]
MHGAVAVLPGGDAVARHAGAQCIDRGGIGHARAVHAAVGLGHHHFQVAAVAGRVEIIDLEGTGSDRGFVQQVAVLPHLHARIAVGDAVHGRRIATLRFGIHAVVGGQLHAAEADAVEHHTVGEGIAEGELAAQRCDGALQAGLHALVMRARPFVARQVADMAEAPWADVEAGVQPQVSLRAGQAGGIDVVDVAHVLQAGGRHAVVPVAGIHVAARLPHHRSLRHRHIEALFAIVEDGACLGHQLVQRCAGMRVVQPGGGLGRKLAEVHADPLEQSPVEARLDIARIVAHLPQQHRRTAQPDLVDIQVGAVFAGRGRVALVEAAQVEAGVARLPQEGVIEVDRGDQRCTAAAGCGRRAGRGGEGAGAGEQGQCHRACRAQP